MIVFSVLVPFSSVWGAMHESPIRMPFALQYRFTYPRQILFKMIWTNMKVGIEAIGQVERAGTAMGYIQAR